MKLKTFYNFFVFSFFRPEWPETGIIRAKEQCLLFFGFNFYVINFIWENSNTLCRCKRFIIFLKLIIKMFYLFNEKCGLPGAARDYFTISLWNCPVQIDLRTLQAMVGGSSAQIKFLYTNPPLGATFVCWPPPNSQSIW